MNLRTEKPTNHKQRIRRRMRKQTTSNKDTGRIETPKWLPIPPPQENCPVTGISGAGLAEFTSQAPETADHPPVRSKLAKQEDVGGEVRVFNIASLYEHLNQFAEKACRLQRRMRRRTTKTR